MADRRASVITAQALPGSLTRAHAPSAYIWIGLGALPLGLWAVRRLLRAAGASRCPRCGSKFYSVPVCGARRYERWHCRACARDWYERYDDWDPREVL